MMLAVELLWWHPATVAQIATTKVNATAGNMRGKRVWRTNHTKRKNITVSKQAAASSRATRFCELPELPESPDPPEREANNPASAPKRLTGAAAGAGNCLPVVVVV